MEKQFLLLSIREKFFTLIKEGKKTWEYRKTIPKKTIQGIVFYCTDSKEFCSVHTPIEVVLGTPKEIATTCLDQPAGADSLLRYYGKNEKVVAYKLKKSRYLPIGFKSKLESIQEKAFKGPQGFTYITANHPLNHLLELGL